MTQPTSNSSFAFPLGHLSQMIRIISRNERLRAFDSSLATLAAVMAFISRFSIVPSLDVASFPWS